jgi:ribonuclease HI/ADP-ribose pyrophosphatase YjhB (NUDIX family)
MKQRVVVQGIIQDNDKILLLRRSQGRPGIIGKYELPGGTLDENEQPDDGMRRHLKNALGITAQALQLHDVMAMTNRDEGDVQHVFVVYTVQGVQQNISVKLGQSYDMYEWTPMLELQQTNLRDSTAYLLGVDGSLKNAKTVNKNHINTVVNKSTNVTHTIIYSDGGSRGNPGPSAAAFVIINGESVVDQGGEYLGITTNNQAEYHGVRLGLERASSLGIKDIEFRIDSMLVVNQLRGIYKIKNRELWPINERIQTLLSSFDSVKFKHVPRELNTMADALVNKFLDEHKSDLT